MTQAVHMEWRTQARGMREYVKGYSLIDITNTGVLAQYNSTLPTFMDNAKQVVKDKEGWDRSRNQQRNWETLTQLMSMITQPTILQSPIAERDVDLQDYNFGYTGNHTVWTFMVGAEMSGIFDAGVPSGRLIDMCNKIPIITGLKETITSEKSMLDTVITPNLYFEKVEF